MSAYTGPTSGSVTIRPDGSAERELFYDPTLTREEEWAVAWFTALSPNERLREALRLQKERDDWKNKAIRQQSLAQSLRQEQMDGVIYTRLTVFKRVYVVRIPKDIPDAQSVHTTAVRAALVKGYHDEADVVESFNEHAAQRLRAYDPGPEWKPSVPPAQSPGSYAKDPGKAGRKIAAKYENVTFEEITD